MLNALRQARPAVLSGWFYLPYEVLGGSVGLNNIKRLLTFRPRCQYSEEPVIIKMYSDRPDLGYFGVPRAWGLARYGGRLPMVDRTVLGDEITVPRLPSPDHPAVRNPEQQRQFSADIAHAFTLQRSFIAKADTGTGKTVVTLGIAGGVLRRKTIILVHLERLMHQWAEEIHDKLGVPEDRIGFVQSDTCDWQGKDFVVAMLHSVNRRRYDRGFYRAFGLAVFDEVHKVGTEFFNPAAHMFPSYYRLGLSATVERDDGGQKVFFNHLGNVAVTSRAPAMPMDVIPVRYVARRQPWGNNTRTRLMCLIQDTDRNDWLAELILSLYRAGRNALIVSYSVDHLQELMELCKNLDIPEEKMGQYTAMKHGGDFCPLVYAGEGDARRLVAKTTEDGGVIVKKQTKKVSGEELTRVKTTCQLVFATYGMVTEGVDEPRWDAGLDATPRKKATQLIGRIRRMHPGKPRPLWLTPYDERCTISKRLFGQRCRDYHETGADVKEIV